MDDWVLEYNVFVRVFKINFYKGGSLKYLCYYFIVLEGG